MGRLPPPLPPPPPRARAPPAPAQRSKNLLPRPADLDARVGQWPTEGHRGLAHAYDNFTGQRGEPERLPGDRLRDRLEKVPRGLLLHDPAGRGVDRGVVHSVPEVVRGAGGPQAARELHIHMEGLPQGTLLESGFARGSTICNAG